MNFDSVEVNVFLERGCFNRDCEIRDFTTTTTTAAASSTTTTIEALYELSKGHLVFKNTKIQLSTFLYLMPSQILENAPR
jgi:hypothetical protein